MAVGSREHWELGIEHSIWGLVPAHEARWKRLSSGAVVFFYATRPVSGFIGYGTVRRTFPQDKPLWPPEIAQKKVIWPLRFEFDIVSLIPPTRWLEDRVVFKEITQARLRSGFFAAPEDIAQQLITRFPKTSQSYGVSRPLTHEEIQRILVEVGQIQRFIAEPEFPIGKQRLDVAWRRMVKAVPTYAFEVQVGGDVLHALGKLKSAYQLWNSRVFLVGHSQEFRPKAEELLEGTFHEIRRELKIIDVAEMTRLHELKREVRETEERLYLT